MTRPIGWWHFDEQHLTMLKPKSGQSIQCLGPFADDAGLDVKTSVNRKWQRFEYRDREVVYPLLVEFRTVPSPKFGRPLVWRVDYVRSAVLHRKESGSGEQVPSHGLWRRIDDCLTDGLLCWPREKNSKDLANRSIAFNGGWLNGAWTPNLFRSFLGTTGVSGREAIRSPAPLIPIDQPPPAPWQRCEGVAIATAMPALARVPAPLRAEVLAAAEYSPYLASADRSRILIPLPKLEQALFRPEDSQRFFYADAEIASDAFHVGVRIREGGSKEWAGCLAWNTCLLLQELGSAHSGIRGAFKQLFPQPSEPLTTRPLVARPLAQVLLDVWLTPGLWPIPSQGKPQITLFGDWHLAGTTSTSFLEACADLDDPMNKLGVMFEETNDGVVRSGAVVPARGWWEFDFESRSLINRTSSERLRLVDGINDFDILKFVYEHKEITYPLQVRRDPRTGTHNPTWILDHESSARAWRERNGAMPGFGLWRRVDDCALDALLFWPELENSGPPPLTVTAAGGWINGAWSPDLRRRHNYIDERGFSDAKDIEAPILESLDALPFRWLFHDAARATHPIGLEGLVELDGGRCWLPQEVAPAGFEGRVPFMRRSDGGAVIFPAGIRSELHRGEDYRARAIFTYADEDVFFSVNATGSWSSWFSFDLNSLFGIGLRDHKRFAPMAPSNLPPDWFGQSWRRPVLSLALSRRLTQSIVDAGLSWTGSTHRLLDDRQHFEEVTGRSKDQPRYEQSGISLQRPEHVCVEGGYRSGRYTRAAEIVAWMEVVSDRVGH